MFIKLKKLLCAGFIALSALTAVASPVFAEENKASSMTASVPITISGSDQGTIVIEKQINGIYRKIDEKTVYRFGVLELTEEDVGKYSYKIYQKNTGLIGITYDDSVYMADVYVLLDERTGRYSAEAVIYHSGSLTKVDSVTFVNKGGPSPRPSPTPTPTPKVTPTPTPTATPCPDCIVNPDGTISRRVDSDYTGDISNYRNYIMAGLCLVLAGIFVYAWRKDTRKER